MDSDLSHEALDRLDALDQRVTALEQAGATSEQANEQTDIFSTPVEAPDEDEE